MISLYQHHRTLVKMVWLYIRGERESFGRAATWTSTMIYQRFLRTDFSKQRRIFYTFHSGASQGGYSTPSTAEQAKEDTLHTISLPSAAADQHRMEPPEMFSHFLSSTFDNATPPCMKPARTGVVTCFARGTFTLVQHLLVSKLNSAYALKDNLKL